MWDCNKYYRIRSLKRKITHRAGREIKWNEIKGETSSLHHLTAWPTCSRHSPGDGARGRQGDSPGLKVWRVGELKQESQRRPSDLRIWKYLTATLRFSLLSFLRSLCEEGRELRSVSAVVERDKWRQQEWRVRSWSSTMSSLLHNVLSWEHYSLGLGPQNTIRFS